MAVVLANSLRFHVQRLPAAAGADAPDRPVVVFLHGLVVDNLSSFYCPLAVPVARAGHEAVLYDLRGHGRTERPATGYDSRTAVRDLLALLGALGLGHRRVHLVGNSYGGTLALHAALARPGLVSGLTLLEPPLSGTWVENMADTLSAAALSLEDSPVPAELRTLRLRKAANLTAVADALLNRTSLIDDVAASRPFTPEDYARLDCPALIVCGEHSELVPGARELARHAPRCALRILPGLGHDVLKESSGSLREAVLAHLASTATATATGTGTATGTATAGPPRTGALVP
ncbi:alpha/beta fold hydrolase [Streptomyces sp. TN58]|uniref:alpha/beta fold hydrolase n=1 Tax=Streptomyces sp. TN58 TaxID=234612 RepID=UPI00095041EF|nr:alpha/beta fold hydrolase [Streptomyces sp. TN58]APU43188.1 alpha/beta hydrolase [Streptomyces sp. TN58]